MPAAREALLLPDLLGCVRHAEPAAIAGEPGALQLLAALFETIGRAEAPAAREQAGPAARLQPAASEFHATIGSPAWVVVPAAVARREPTTEAPVESRLPANMRLMVEATRGDWVKVQWVRLRAGEHALTWKDGRTEVPHASVTDAAAWVPRTQLDEAPLDPDALRRAASGGKVSDRIRALELLVAIAPSADARRVLGRAAFDVGLYAQAVEALAPLDRNVVRRTGGADIESAVEFIQGCRGDRMRPTLLGDVVGTDTERLLEEWSRRVETAPVDACVGLVDVGPWCGIEERAAKASERLRSLLSRRFPLGPWLRIAITHHGPDELQLHPLLLHKERVGPQTCDGIAVHPAGTIPLDLPSVPPHTTVTLWLKLDSTESARWVVTKADRALGEARGPTAVDCSISCGPDPEAE